MVDTLYYFNEAKNLKKFELYINIVLNIVIETEKILCIWNKKMKEKHFSFPF